MRPEDRPGAILLVAAHPDDETIGVGAQLWRWRERVVIVHVTDGSPPDLRDAKAAGCVSREEYASLRRRELLEAMDAAGISPDCCLSIGVGDQRASWEMPHIARRLRELFRDIQPRMILTHPYEGGHPDHDACALAVSLAARQSSIPVWEFTSYHAGPEGRVSGRFLDPAGAVFNYALSGRERRRKREMLDSFRSQRHMLANFGVDRESLRAAPAYDFTRPPHDGALHYESFDWGITGRRWRGLAAVAIGSGECAAHAANHP